MRGVSVRSTEYIRTESWPMSHQRKAPSLRASWRADNKNRDEKWRPDTPGPCDSLHWHLVCAVLAAHCPRSLVMTKGLLFITSGPPGQRVDGRAMGLYWMEASEPIPRTNGLAASPVLTLPTRTSTPPCLNAGPGWPSPMKKKKGRIRRCTRQADCCGHKAGQRTPRRRQCCSLNAACCRDTVARQGVTSVPISPECSPTGTVELACMQNCVCAVHRVAAGEEPSFSKSRLPERWLTTAKVQKNKLRGWWAGGRGTDR